MRRYAPLIAQLLLLTFPRLVLGGDLHTATPDAVVSPITEQVQRLPTAGSNNPAAAQLPLSCAKFLVIDAIEPETGVVVNLDAEITAEGSLFERRDAQLTGELRLPSGDRVPILVAIASKYAHAIKLVRVSEGSDKYKVIAEGISDVASSSFEITLTEHGVPGTSVRRIQGQLYDTSTKRRLIFTITHDPAPIVVIGVIAAAAVIICGAIVLANKLKNDCTAKAREQCGPNRVKEVTAVRTYGFSWDKSGPRVGCGEDCKITCIDK